MAMKHVREKVHPISHDDLIDVCKYWVDIAMNISERDLKLMNRLVRAQDKLMDNNYLPNKYAKMAS